MNRFINLTLLFFSVTLVSCSTFSKKVKPATSPAYQSAGSFCLDSYILRSAVEGCTDWEMNQVTNLLEVRCKKKSHPGDNDWTDHTFVWFQKSESLPDIPKFSPICVDENSVFGKIVP